MQIGVLGTGMVGLAIGNRLAGLGHEVMIGTRDPSKSLEKLRSKSETVQVGTFAAAASFGELIFNATNGVASLHALQLAGGQNLAGKVLVDVSNPLDFSRGNPPSLSVSNTDSLAEQIQRAFPAARLVKALNMVTAAVMVDPQATGGGDHDAFVCGNDAAARERVIELLKQFGWSHITDLGDLTAARCMEMYLPLWLRLWGALGTGMFNIKVVR